MANTQMERCPDGHVFIFKSKLSTHRQCANCSLSENYLSATWMNRHSAPAAPETAHEQWCASVPRSYDAARGLGTFRCDCKPRAETAPDEELVIEIARELYDRFIMGGWEPQDAYPAIREWLVRVAR